jgi:hypothetical protein
MVERQVPAAAIALSQAGLYSSPKYNKVVQ